MKWTEKNTNKLLELVDELGFAWLEISRIMKKTPDSVRMRYRKVKGETGAREHIEVILPKVGMFDVETLPMENYNWKMYGIDYVSPEQVIKETCLLGWSGKFLNESKMYSDVLTPKEALKRNGRRVAKSCWKFIRMCDILVGHNLIKFDFRVVNTYFLKYELPPLKPLLLDTLQIAKKNFRFESNKMEYINQRLGLETKMEHEGFRLWKKCAQGEKKALTTMRKYNEQDVVALEDLYYKLRPYINKQKYNVALYNTTNERVCPVCGSQNLKKEGWYNTPAGRWRTYRCIDCTGIFRGKENSLSKNKKKTMLVPY